jgi:parvulin-like peptidyl-prolyl isomerase
MTEENQAKSTMKKVKENAVVVLRSRRGKIFVAVVCVAFAVFVAVWEVYARPVTDQYVRFAAAVIPFPAVSVDGERVSIKNFLEEYDAALRYLNGRDTAPNTDEMEMAIVNSIINKMAIRQLSESRAINVDSERVEEYYREIISGGDEEQFEKELRDEFGWSVEDFRERVVESVVLALQMNDEILRNEDDQKDRRTVIDGAYARISGGEDFSSVARDIHSGFGGTSQFDLGYATLSEMQDFLLSAVKDLPVGSFTDVLDTKKSFAIYRVEDRIIVADDVQIRLLTVSVPKKTLEEVVRDYLESVKVKRYVGKI